MPVTHFNLPHQMVGAAAHPFESVFIICEQTLNSFIKTKKKNIYYRLLVLDVVTAFFFLPFIFTL